MQRLLNSPRQNRRLASGGVRQALTDRKSLLVILISILLILLVLALLFLQANVAASNLKSANEENYSILKSDIARTTETIAKGDIQNSEDRNKYMSALTDLATTSDQIAETCATATKPLVPSMAKNYTELTNRCEEVTSSARELRDALNAFMPVAQYQGDLLTALAPTVSYHGSEQKADIDKGISEWRKTRELLQRVAPPMDLVETNSSLINIAAEIISELESARDAKAKNDIAQYRSHLTELGQHYATFNDLAKPIHKSLVESQKTLTKAATSIQ